MKSQLAIVVLMLLTMGRFSEACNVPVFRYALERWPAEPYIAMIIADEPLTKAEQRAMERLEAASDGSAGWLNLMVRRWTSEQVAGNVLAGKLPRSDSKGARLHLLYPVSEAVQTPFWSGALTDEAVLKIVDSPLRKKLIERILAGDSGVFILLECGDQAKDDQAAALVSRYLQEMTEMLQLPGGVEEADGSVTGGISSGGDPINRLRSPIPLKLAFSTLRFAYSHDDLIGALLLQIPENAKGSRKEPMVFAVYGRGRVLPALVGIEDMRHIDQVTAFLTGACSCQIKAMNPGTDLLLNHNWDQSVFGWGGGGDE